MCTNIINGKNERMVMQCHGCTNFLFQGILLNNAMQINTRIQTRTLGARLSHTWRKKYIVSSTCIQVTIQINTRIQTGTLGARLSHTWRQKYIVSSTCIHGLWIKVKRKEGRLRLKSRFQGFTNSPWIQSFLFFKSNPPPT